MLMLLDSAGLYFRAFHASPESITAPDGTPTNAVRGFLDMTAALVASRRPTQLVACWDDDWRPQWRVDLLPTYKAHRVAVEGGEEVPDALTPQVGVIADVLAAIGIARVGAAGYEADDIMGTLAHRCGAAGEPVEVVSGDRDMVQLVDDSAGITLLYVGRGIRRMQVLDEAAVVAAYGVAPQQYAEMSILRGDPSDGLPGIPGIGAKGAATLLTTYGSLEALLAAADAEPPTLRGSIVRALRDGRDYLTRAQEVVRTAEVALPELDATLPATPADPQRLAELVERWGIGGAVGRLTEAIAQAATQV